MTPSHCVPTSNKVEGVHERMNALSLFSGIAGLDESIKAIARPLLYVEINPFCQQVLRQRMAQGDIPEAPIHEDITALTPERCREYLGGRDIDIITAGMLL